ncbi:MAG: L-aspartate oxidase [Chloroflexus sp.]|uniref:L-aspartate oxidase n=1 Tax=Chloroflexus sp. TaxID=1904827 RepID=UPI0021DBC9FA|nr:L-aspartate oxidase [Chloroflexus sp.]GIV90988.1 MAG: L-aspartate oxidase [Chloroflexus sp.]
MDPIPAPRSAVSFVPPACDRQFDVLVIGAGAAGLTAALAAAAAGARVLVLARGTLPESNSAWAQGGIAAALDPTDSPHLHIADTLAAGAGLCDVAAVTTLAHEAPTLMRELAALGVPFERDADRFALGLEGGHSRRRIVHVGDATGWAVTRVLIDRVRATPRITVREQAQAIELLTAGKRVVGALVRLADGTWWRVLAAATVLATGGAGALYGLTSNQPIALGEGIALAYRAGAEVADMEFVQFHPTVYRTRDGHGFLITEAARGEGGRLYTPSGRRFMPDYDPRAELAPRDVVTRGIMAAMQAEGCDYVLLDLTHLPADRIEHHFPTIVARLRADGIDPVRDPIPVAPAAHYLMGGVRTDLNGATNLPGLFAAGEVACTGVHGANRLASNSLLECLVFGRRAGEAAATWRRIPLPLPDPLPVSLTTTAVPVAWREHLATIMRAAGPLRHGDTLRRALIELESWPMIADPFDPEAITAVNAGLTARLIVASALLRTESRGGHFRQDYPQSDEAWRKHTILRLRTPPCFAPTIAPPPEWGRDERGIPQVATMMEQIR